MKISNIFIIVVIALLNVQTVLCFFEPITLIVGSFGGFLGAGYEYLKCKAVECCNDKNVPINIIDLQTQLASQLYGQHIVQKTVIRALRGYKDVKDPPKALALSFHGPTGTGKNFVSSMIIKSFYRHGMKSNFFHSFSGSTFSKSRLEEHKELIKNTIVKTLQQCERSIFVFDEVDDMPEGLLDILLPFLDYAQPFFIEYKTKRIRISSNKAIFIFLTNVSATRIIDEMLKFWLNGRKRDSLRLQDFEHLLSGDALMSKGGFLNSNTIKSSLIDYYVPFLPLEEEHVKMCMRDAFDSDIYTDPPTPLMEEEVLSAVTYGPENYNIYAKSGCKHVHIRACSARHIGQDEEL